LDTGLGSTKDQGMNIAVAFVGFDGFQNLTSDESLESLGNPVATVHVAGFTGNVESH